MRKPDITRDLADEELVARVSVGMYKHDGEKVVTLSVEKLKVASDGCLV